MGPLGGLNRLGRKEKLTPTVSPRPSGERLVIIWPEDASSRGLRPPLGVRSKYCALRTSISVMPAYRSASASVQLTCTLHKSSSGGAVNVGTPVGLGISVQRSPGPSPVTNCTVKLEPFGVTERASELGLAFAGGAAELASVAPSQVIAAPVHCRTITGLKAAAAATKENTAHKSNSHARGNRLIFMRSPGKRSSANERLIVIMILSKTTNSRCCYEIL